MTRRGRWTGDELARWIPRYKGHQEGVYWPLLFIWECHDRQFPPNDQSEHRCEESESLFANSPLIQNFIRLGVDTGSNLRPSCLEQYWLLDVQYLRRNIHGHYDDMP